MKSINWREERVQNELAEINGFSINDLKILDKFDDDIIDRVILVLLEWACYPQNDAGILLGRRFLSEVPKACLEKHIVNVVRNGFEYEDDWNYRRLLEAVTDIVPNCKDDILQINSNSTDNDIIEVVDDFSK